MHRAQLRQAEPPHGHELRFLAMQHQRHRCGLRRIAMQVAAAAAVALLTIGLTGLAAWCSMGELGPMRYAVGRAMEHYIYIDQINTQLSDVERMARTCRPDLLPEVTRVRHELQAEHRILLGDLLRASPSTLNLLVGGEHAQMQAVEHLRLAMAGSGCDDTENN